MLVLVYTTPLKACVCVWGAINGSGGCFKYFETVKICVLIGMMSEIVACWSPVVAIRDLMFCPGKVGADSV